jgi:predicted amidophosphoribosyltransferase
MSFTFEPNVLYRHRYTESQTGMLNKKKRLQNIHGCFSMKHPEVIRDRNIILIDDIVTTGATVKEAARILKKAGAKKVLIFSMAH